jgi:hypothetical protein
MRVHLQEPRRALQDVEQLGVGVGLEQVGHAEARPQGRGQQAHPRRGADQREGRQRVLHGAGRRPLADDEVEVTVFHGRVERLFHDRRETMDLVDEQDVPEIQVGEQRGEVAGLLDRGTARRSQAHPGFGRDHVSERRLAEAGRAVEQHVVQGLAPPGRRADEDAEIVLDARLPHVLAESLGAQGNLMRVQFAGGRGQQVLHGAGARAGRPLRTGRPLGRSAGRRHQAGSAS